MRAIVCTYVLRTRQGGTGEVTRVRVTQKRVTQQRYVCCRCTNAAPFSSRVHPQIHAHAPYIYVRTYDDHHVVQRPARRHEARMRMYSTVYTVRKYVRTYKSHSRGQAALFTCLAIQCLRACSPCGGMASRSPTSVDAYAFRRVHRSVVRAPCGWLCMMLVITYRVRQHEWPASDSCANGG